MKKFSIVAIIALLFLSGCTNQAKPAGTFRVAVPASPPAIDPANAIETIGIDIAHQLFDGLVKYNPKTLAVEPAVAKSWKVGKQAKEFTFFLRSGSKFHNGEEVTANSFKKAWDYVADPRNKSQAAYYLEPILGYEEMQEKKAKGLKGVKVLDKYTLKITLSRPYADFMVMLPAPAFSPLPDAVLTDKEFAKHPIGNGPFSFVSWKRNKEIALNNFKDYYGQKALVKKAVYKIFTTDVAALREYKAGNVDASPIPESQVSAVKGDKALAKNMKKADLLSIYAYSFNVEKKPWDNKKLRQAIAHSIYSKFLLKKAVPNATMAKSFTAAAVPGNSEATFNLKFSLAKARKLIKEAGYDSASDVGPVTITYPNAGESNSRIAQVVQNQLEKVGFEVKIEGMEFGSFIDKMMTGELGMFPVSWVGEPSFNAFLEPNFTTKNIGINNVNYYSNKKADALIEKAQGTLSEGKRVKLFRQAEEMILNDVPVIPLYHATAYDLVSPKVNNFQRTALDYLVLEEIEVE